MEERLQVIKTKISETTCNNAAEFKQILEQLTSGHNGTVDEIIVIYSLINLHINYLTNIDVQSNDKLILEIKKSIIRLLNQLSDKYDHPNKDKYPHYLLDMCKNILLETDDLLNNDMLL
jgi:hypothetical protein